MRAAAGRAHKEGETTQRVEVAAEVAAGGLRTLVWPSVGGGDDDGVGAQAPRMCMCMCMCMCML